MTAIDINNVREKLDNSRHRAAQYLEKAAHSNDPAAKAEALDLAETWRSIAQRTEKLLNQLEIAGEPTLPDVFRSVSNDAALSEPAMALD